MERLAVSLFYVWLLRCPCFTSYDYVFLPSTHILTQSIFRLSNWDFTHVLLGLQWTTGKFTSGGTAPQRLDFSQSDERMGSDFQSKKGTHRIPKAYYGIKMLQSSEHLLALTPEEYGLYISASATQRGQSARHCPWDYHL